VRAAMQSSRLASLLALLLLPPALSELTKEEMEAIDKEFRDNKVQALISGIVKEETPKEAKLKKAPIKAVVPYIRCGVCNVMAARAHERILALHEDALANPPVKGKRRFDSAEQEHASRLRVNIDDVVATLCDADNSTTGRWMNEYDIVQRATTIDLKHMGEGHCKRECRTIERACWDVLETVDDELGDTVYDAIVSGKSSADSTFQVCNRLSDVCKKRNIPKFEGKRETDFPHPTMTDRDRYIRLLQRDFDLRGKRPGNKANMHLFERHIGDADEDTDVD